MSYEHFDEFRAARDRAQTRLQSVEHLGLKRFLRMDAAAYEDLTAKGGLDTKTKELLGLVASTVLRCDDCINYHVEQCLEAGWTVAELEDAFNVAMIVGGSITIPHIRRAMLMVDELSGDQ